MPHRGGEELASRCREAFVERNTGAPDDSCGPGTRAAVYVAKYIKYAMTLSTLGSVTTLTLPRVREGHTCLKPTVYLIDGGLSGAIWALDSILIAIPELSRR